MISSAHTVIKLSRTGFNFLYMPTLKNFCIFFFVFQRTWRRLATGVAQSWIRSVNILPLV